MAAPVYPFREAMGLGLAWLDQEDDLLAEILKPTPPFAHVERAVLAAHERPIAPGLD